MIKRYSLFIVLTIGFTLIGLPVGLFWDNVLFVGKTSTFLYENGLLSWFDIPVKYSPPHPYLCGTYYALVWKIFGRSLLTSHLATAPVILGVFSQLWILCHHFFTSEKETYSAFFLACLSPVLCSHCVQIGQELFILLFALYALNAILSQKHIHKAIALCFLPLFSLRAMMICAGLFLTEWFICRLRAIPFWEWKKIGAYLGGFCISIIYLVLRYDIFSGTPSQIHFGYFDYGSPGQILYTFVKNCIVLVWEYVDFGQITLFAIIIAIILRNRRKILYDDKIFTELCICSIMPCSIVIITSLISQNPFAHHYFLPSLICIILVAYYLLQYSPIKKWLYILMAVSLLGGNLIVYPEYKAQGWQNSLAHLPYWSLRREAIAELDRRDIPLEKTASFFPNVYSNDFIELNGDKRAFCPFTGKEDFVFYSSCYNPLDEEINLLHSQYTPIFTSRRGLVFVQILEHR